MKLAFRILSVVSVVFSATALSDAAVPIVSRGGTSTKFVWMTCRPGWRGSAGGVYGGEGFFVSCNRGRGLARLTGAVGTTYSIRMGVESPSTGLDCFFSGDSATVNESCGAVPLTIY